MRTVYATLVVATLSGSASALAQSSTTGGTAATTPTTTATTVPQDDGGHFPWGILGLFGLAGLYPLFADRRKATVVSTTPGKKL